jgi:hypothetical protein
MRLKNNRTGNKKEKEPLVKPAALFFWVAALQGGKVNVPNHMPAFYFATLPLYYLPLFPTPKFPVRA